MGTSIVRCCRRTKMALELMLQNCVDVQSENKDWFKNLSPKDFINSVCTIKLGGPRTSGHSSAIVQVWEAYFDKVAVISWNESMERNIKEYAEEWLIDRMWFTTVRQFPIHSMGREFDAVLVDCAWSLSTKELDSIIKACEPFAQACRGNSKPFCFALIQ